MSLTGRVYASISTNLYYATNVDADLQAGWAACNLWTFGVQRKSVDLFVLSLPLLLISDYGCTYVFILRGYESSFRASRMQSWHCVHEGK